jgi:hypothetical protein
MNMPIRGSSINENKQYARNQISILFLKEVHYGVVVVNKACM